MDLQQKPKPSSHEGLVNKILFCHKIKQCYVGWRGGLMVSAFFPRPSGPGSSPGQGHCIAFLDKTLNSQTASPHLGVQMGAATLMLGVAH